MRNVKYAIKMIALLLLDVSSQLKMVYLLWVMYVPLELRKCTGHSKDVNGVCRGIVFAYTFFNRPVVTYITVLVHFPVTSLSPYWAFDVHEICIFDDLLLC